MRVAATDMPRGRYLTCALDVNPDAGGQMRALLMRNRILAREAAISPAVLTFRPLPDYAERRGELVTRGLLLPEIPLLNVFDHYRENDWSLPKSTGRDLVDLGDHVVGRTDFSDGTPWRVTYRLPGATRSVHDYLRPDGTAFVRIPEMSFADPGSWPRKIQAVTKTGEVARVFSSLGQWYRLWIRTLTEYDDRVFVFIDSRHVVPHLVPMRARNVHLIYVLHNIHTRGPRRWDSDLVSPVYSQVLDRIPGMDAMVTLTHRQRADIARRVGETDNLFVVPNPVQRREPVEGVVRDPRRVAFVARLEAQKRPTEAVRAFARVVEEVPGARLDIYGAGRRLRAIARLTRRLGLDDAITQHGHDPHARDALWRASAFMMTSSFEGYPLSTLESMSHGCPVVSYDVKYGPREQITDGVDGFLVPDGDVEALAERVIRLLTSPDLVQRMSEAALAKAEQHGTEQFLHDWAQVLGAVVRQKRERTVLQAVHLDLHDLMVHEPWADRLRLRRRARGLGENGPSDGLRLDAVLRVDAQGPPRLLDTARLELDAVRERSGEVVELPLTFERVGSRFHLSSRLALRDVLGADGPDETARLRLRLVWHNSAWQAYLTRPGVTSGLQVGFGEGDTFSVRRLGATPDAS